jgi:hypothetical protein
MAPDPDRQNYYERWARDELAIIERCGIYALSPAPSLPEEVSPRPKRPRRARAKKGALAPRPESPSDIASDDATVLNGGCTLAVESREQLELFVTKLRPAFDELTKRFLSPTTGSDLNDSEFVHKKLGELFQAAFWIGAMAAIPEGARKYFEPKIQNDQAQMARHGRAEKFDKSDERIWRVATMRSCIEQCEREGKKVTAAAIKRKLEALHKPTPHEMRSDRTIRRDLEKIREEKINRQS